MRCYVCVISGSPWGAGSNSLPPVPLRKNRRAVQEQHEPLPSPPGCRRVWPRWCKHGRCEGRDAGCCADLWCPCLPPPPPSPGLLWFSSSHLSVSPDVSSCPGRFGGIQAPLHPAGWMLHVQKLCTATCLGSPDVSAHAGVLSGCQTPGDVRSARMHGSPELLLVRELMMPSWNWTLLGSLGWTKCACVIQLLLVCLKEMQDLNEELVCVCPSPARPQRD